MLSTACKDKPKKGCHHYTRNTLQLVVLYISKLTPHIIAFFWAKQSGIACTSSFLQSNCFLLTKTINSLSYVVTVKFNYIGGVAVKI
jgi:hypothetical protein